MVDFELYILGGTEIYGSEFGHYNFLYPNYNDTETVTNIEKIISVHFIGPENMIAFRFENKELPKKIYWAYKKNIGTKFIRINGEVSELEFIYR